jgi:tetratricopeptide (TPR) repeat protein
MSKTEVLTRKDMKEPDKFQVAATQAASWMVSRKKHLVVAAGAVVAVMVIAAIFSTLRVQREKDAGVAASALLGVMAGRVSAVPLPGLPGPFYPDEQTRQRAILVEADRVVAAHPGTGPAALAELARGDAHFKLRAWDDAAAAYQRFLAAAPQGDSLRFSALEGLGLVAEAKGDLAGAAAAYERMGKEAPKLADRADLERARVLQAAGKTAEAKELLAAFPERHKDSALATQAADALGRLGGK